MYLTLAHAFKERPEEDFFHIVGVSLSRGRIHSYSVSGKGKAEGLFHIVEEPHRQRTLHALNTGRFGSYDRLLKGPGLHRI